LVKFPRTWSVALCLAALLTMGHAHAARQVVAVLYPEVRAPYNQVFEDVIQGVKRESSGKVKKLALRKGFTETQVQDWISKVEPDVVVTLGNRGGKMAKVLRDKYPVVSGSTFFSNKTIAAGFNGIALSPSPGKLFARLRAISPQVKRISVVYHAPTNGWLVDQAEASAKAHGFELSKYAASDIRDAAQKYRQVMAKQENGFDAIWLLQGDPTLDERGLLPTLLSDAWVSHSIVFSSNPSHVRRGALFSLYPDNENMGRSLWKLCEATAAGQAPGVVPLQDLFGAINVRTAEHLNLNLGRSDLREYQLIFPVK